MQTTCPAQQGNTKVSNGCWRNMALRLPEIAGALHFIKLARAVASVKVEGLCPTVAGAVVRPQCAQGHEHLLAVGMLNAFF